MFFSQGSVDSEEEERDDGGGGGVPRGGVQEVGGEGGEDFITICDTRVRCLDDSHDDGDGGENDGHDDGDWECDDPDPDDDNLGW